MWPAPFANPVGAPIGGAAPGGGLLPAPVPAGLVAPAAVPVFAPAPAGGDPHAALNALIAIPGVPAALAAQQHYQLKQQLLHNSNLQQQKAVKVLQSRS